jgi:hypothetical protein
VTSLWQTYPCLAFQKVPGRSAKGSKLKRNILASKPSLGRAHAGQLNSLGDSELNKGEGREEGQHQHKQMAAAKDTRKRANMLRFRDRNLRGPRPVRKEGRAIPAAYLKCSEARVV